MWAYRGLLGLLVLGLVTGLGLLILIPLYSVPSTSPDQVVALQGSVLLLSWILPLLAVGSGIAYSVGFAGLYASRREFGLDHAESVEETLPWLAVTMVP